MPCETCGAEPRFMMKAQAKINQGIKDAARADAKRIRQLEKDLAAALKPEPIPERTELVDLQGIIDRATQQRLVGWNMAQLTFDDLDNLAAEVLDLRRFRDERR